MRTVIQMTDATGWPVELGAPPRRIVSLVPSTTETVFALGSGEQVVGVTRYCVRPDEARQRARVIGGTKSPRIDVIRRLEPDLILANQEENREQDVRKLRTLAPVYVAFPRDVPSAVAEILNLGILLDREGSARRLAAELADSLARVREKSAARPPYSHLYLIWQNPYLCAGPGTFIDALLSETGGRNVIPSGQTRYPEIALQQMQQLAPQVIFLSSEPFPFAEQDRKGLAEKLSGLDWERRCLRVDGQLLSWHGVRMREGLPYVAGLASEVAALAD